MWKNRAFRTRMPKWRTSSTKRHKAVQHGKALTRGRGRGAAGRGNYGRGRGNFRQQGASTSERSGEGANAWIATAHATHSSEVNRLCNNKIEWLLDSGCSDHIINNENYFEKCIELKEPVNIYLGDNRSVKATKIGNVVSYFNAFGEKNEVNMSNVFYAEKMNTNLISFGKLTDNNTIISKGNKAEIVDKNNKLIAVAYKENRIYKINSNLKQRENFVNTVECTSNNMSLKEKWHRMLGHINFGYLNTLCKQELLTGIPKELESEFMKCKTYIENKMHNVPFKNNRSRAKDILEIIHTDVCGPFKTTGFNGENYFVSIIDDYSKIARVYCIKTKDKVFDCIVKYTNETENLTGKRVKILRCDNGKEYLNNRFYKFAKEKGIILNNCPVYVHELNGTAERFNRTIMDMARCLLTEANVHKRFWPEIICATTYLKNRTLTNTIERKTPYEIFFNKRPDVKHLRLYGSRVFIRKPEQKRISKWDKKADMGILLGYSDVGYRVLLNNKMIVARHVEIVEENVNCIGLDVGSKVPSPSTSTFESFRGDQNDRDDDLSDDNVFQSADENDEQEPKVANKKNLEILKVPRRSTRDRKSPIRYPENISNNIHVNYCRVDTPYTFEEAMSSNDSESWIKAMDKEIESLNENKTWKIVEKIPNEQVIDVKWVYSKKSDDTYKARLVVRGFQQTNLIDDIYAPVAKMQTLKILFSFCCQNGLIIEEMDVVTAFLNGEVSSEVYVGQPKGYSDGTNRVCKLRKALYGL